MNVRGSPYWKAALLGIATEVVLGLLPGLLISSKHVPAEVAAPIFYTHIPGLIVASPLFLIENPRNAGLIEPVEIYVAVAGQTAFWGWLWHVLLRRRLKHSTDLGPVDP